MLRATHASRRILLAGTAATILFAPAVAAAQAHERPVKVDIGAQPMRAALYELGRETQTSILFSPTAVPNLNSPPVRGVLSPRAAAERITRGANLRVTIDGQGALLVRARPPIVQTAMARATPIAVLSPIAQAAAPLIAAAEPDVEEVVVTGSRIARSGFQTPTPVTAFAEADIEGTALRSVQALETEIPALMPNQVSGLASQVGRSTLDLRNLGTSRTLVLIDGKRFAATSPDGTINVNVIPSALVKRIEVVTGGASAAYGSDAVAGVVNFFLDSDYTGLKGDIQYGQTQYDDAKELSGSLTFGTAFAGDKGHFVISAEGYRNPGVSTQSRRDWASGSWANIANPFFVPGSTAGGPRQLIVPGTRLSRETAGGVIVSPGPLRNIQFLEGGVPAPFRPGTFVGGTFMIGGDGAEFSLDNSITPYITRRGGYSSVKYEFSEALRAHADVLYGRSYAYYDINPSHSNGDIQIRRDNAFLPASIRATMVANNIPSFLMGRANYDLAPIAKGFTLLYAWESTWRYSAGLDGRLSDRWSWDATYTYSRNTNRTEFRQNRNEVNFRKATDSIINPATGRPICRSTLTDPNDGCVPINLFGPNSVSPEASAYVMGTSFSDSVQEQQNVSANLQGAIFNLPAGPVDVAVGAEYRHEQVDLEVDALSRVDAWRAQNVKPLHGVYRVKEAYAEVLVPVLKDMAWARSLELNGAVRATDYSTSGRVNTWKAGASYAPTDTLRLRGTVSRDIRAPNINELFSAQRSMLPTINDPSTNSSSTVSSITGGNPNLEPEKSDSWTVGVVYEPSWAPGLRLSADAYDFEIQGAISSTAAQTIVDNCFIRKQDTFCGQISRNPVTGQISQVRAVLFNAQERLSRGYDFEVVYGFPASNLVSSWPGDLRFRLLATYAKDSILVTDGVAYDEAGSEALPHWRGNFEVRYQNGPWTGRFSGRFVDNSLRRTDWVKGVDVNDNTVSGQVVVGLYLQYDFDRVELYGKIDNILNTDPPLTPGGNISPQQSANPMFDELGRRFAIGARFEF